MASTSTSITSTTILISSTISTLPSHTNSVLNDPVPAHNVNPIVAFIIGLAIILLASILNAAGLNLTKLDHVGLGSGTPNLLTIV
jgi:amino acid transporter